MRTFQRSCSHPTPPEKILDSNADTDTDSSQIHSSLLQLVGLQYDVIHDDIGSAFRAQRARTQDPTLAFDFTVYHPLDEVRPSGGSRVWGPGPKLDPPPPQELC